MRIAVAGDSAGEDLAKRLVRELTTAHDLVEVSRTDAGADPYYANLAERVARGVLEGAWDRAVLICGTGIGVSIAANKIPGIRAALCHDTYSAERAALSNNAQIITMGARVIGPELAKTIVLSFLARSFDENGASRDNVAAINAVDRKYHHGQ
jgi:RpiB/LacA/LacB family sugar-phosphate isomerase